MPLLDCPYAQCDYEASDWQDILKCETCGRHIVLCPECHTPNIMFAQYCRSCRKYLYNTPEWACFQGNAGYSGFASNCCIPVDDQGRVTIHSTRFEQPGARAKQVTIPSNTFIPIPTSPLLAYGHLFFFSQNGEIAILSKEGHIVAQTGPINDKEQRIVYSPCISKTMLAVPHNDSRRIIIYDLLPLIEGTSLPDDPVAAWAMIEAAPTRIFNLSDLPVEGADNLHPASHLVSDGENVYFIAKNPDTSPSWLCAISMDAQMQWIWPDPKLTYQLDQEQVKRDLCSPVVCPYGGTSKSKWVITCDRETLYFIDSKSGPNKKIIAVKAGDDFEDIEVRSPGFGFAGEAYTTPLFLVQDDTVEASLYIVMKSGNIRRFELNSLETPTPTTDSIGGMNGINGNMAFLGDTSADQPGGLQPSGIIFFLNATFTKFDYFNGLQGGDGKMTDISHQVGSMNCRTMALPAGFGNTMILGVDSFQDGAPGFMYLASQIGGTLHTMHTNIEAGERFASSVLYYNNTLWFITPKGTVWMYPVSKR